MQHDFISQAIVAGETKAHMPLPLMLVKGFMAGALLAVAAVFAITIGHQTGSPIVGAVLFPVGFCLIYLMGYDLVTGIFVLVPMALLSRDSRVTIWQTLQSFVIFFLANFAGALCVATIMAVVFTLGFTAQPSSIGNAIANIGEARTVGYKEAGFGGLATVFLRAALCNWMVSMAVIGSFMSRDTAGKVIVMWMPIMLFFAMTFEHSVVNMFLFPFALLLGGNFSIADYLLWNELPVLVGNLVGGMMFTAMPLLLIKKWQLQ